MCVSRSAVARIRQYSLESPSDRVRVVSSDMGATFNSWRCCVRVISPSAAEATSRRAGSVVR